MKIEKSSTQLILIQFIAILFVTCSAIELHIDPNYILGYNVNYSDNLFEFRVRAINVTGWVGIGINDKSADLDGADIFIGGHHASNNTGYGDDYHVPFGSGNIQPISDDEQNWDLVTSAETNNTTTFTVQRLLKTTDMEQDTEIQNQTTYLLWSYNWDNDDVTVAENFSKGVICINLLRTPPIWTVPTTTTTTTTTVRSAASFTRLPACFPVILSFVAAKISKYLQQQ